MNYSNLAHTLAIKVINETDVAGSFTISGLYPGYGLTIANSLRRVLLSSLPGAAITHIKVKGTDHEFSTLPGLTQDLIELSLNLKRIRLRLFSDEPQILTLKVKGEREVTAADIKTSSQVEIINPDQFVASLTAKSAELDIELTVERGLGYRTAQDQANKKLDIGVIALDALFSPVKQVNYQIENIRVGDRTDYNRINLDLLTDGTIKPSEALNQAAILLQNHFSAITNGLNGSTARSEAESTSTPPADSETPAA